MNGPSFYRLRRTTTQVSPRRSVMALLSRLNPESSNSSRFEVNIASSKCCTQMDASQRKKSHPERFDRSRTFTISARRLECRKQSAIQPRDQVSYRFGAQRNCFDFTQVTDRPDPQAETDTLAAPSLFLRDQGSVDVEESRTLRVSRRFSEFSRIPQVSLEVEDLQLSRRKQNRLQLFRLDSPRRNNRRGTWIARSNWRQIRARSEQLSAPISNRARTFPPHAPPPGPMFM